MRAVACHVFAGGFTQGVRRVFDVDTHLEHHNLGHDTARSMGVSVITDWDKADVTDVTLLYGNPRCTAFSTVTGGYSCSLHGPRGKQVIDLIELCRFGVGHDVPYVVWESVPQVMSTGRVLLREVADEFISTDRWRVAHVLLRVAMFGNAQIRRRYFFVAYPRGKTFNVGVPDRISRQATLRDAIRHLEDRRTNIANLCSTRCYEYNDDSFCDLSDREWRVVPVLQEGECLNRMCERRPEVLERACPEYYEKCVARTSRIPFSLHALRRLTYDIPCPNIFSSSGRWLHPTMNRPLTIGELRAVMSWDDDVELRGPLPIQQLGKGVVPDAGEWIAQQVLASVNDAWDDDWETVFDGNDWVGEDSSEKDEKILNVDKWGALT